MAMVLSLCLLVLVQIVGSWDYAAKRVGRVCKNVSRSLFNVLRSLFKARSRGIGRIEACTSVSQGKYQDPVAAKCRSMNTYTETKAFR
ncbi:hypothetical protein FB567DRAFT_200171 [Paraphoma chrysanthemicola]|uniref:Secreted protein n=1 Tax=Paraphoma chrysanthemicola TaxID=798071 RepID=A0A8K0QVE2_9PLEO|nr:hypothetical protein FB567DRAFT_200171 [Paraphoma chrysanthemicola]